METHWMLGWLEENNDDLRRQLAEMTRLANNHLDDLSAVTAENAWLQHDLAEAATCVRALLAYVRADRIRRKEDDRHGGLKTCGACQAYDGLPAWMRKEIEE